MALWSLPGPFLFLLVFLVTASGCHREPLPSSPPENRIVVFRGRDNPPTLDPAYASRTFDGHLACLIHGGLVRSDEEGRVIPEFAESWGVNEQGSVYSFRLRSSLRFPDGQPVQTSDVVYSWDRICHPETASPVSWIFEDVVGFEEISQGKQDTLSGLKIESATELTVTLKEPSATFLAKLTMPGARIVDEREIGRNGKGYGRNPKGLGAWELAEWEDDSHILLHPNPAYPDRNTHLRGIRFDLISKDFSAGARFETGELHILNPLPSTQSDYWKGFSDWVPMIRPSPQLNFYYLGFTCDRDPFQRVEVRRAISKAIEVDQIRKTLYGSKAALAGGPIPPGLTGHWEGPSGAAEITESDRQILSSLDFEIAFPDIDPMASLVMEGFQANLREYGAQCRLRRLDRTAYTSWRREGKFDAFLGNWWADYPDPDNFIYPLFVSDSDSNMTRFSDHGVDDLADLARKEVDSGVRHSIYQQIIERLRSQSPMVFLWHLNEEVLVQPWVRGFKAPRLFQGSLYLDLRIEPKD